MLINYFELSFSNLVIFFIWSLCSWTAKGGKRGTLWGAVRLRSGPKWNDTRDENRDRRRFTYLITPSTCEPRFFFSSENHLFHEYTAYCSLRYKNNPPVKMNCHATKITNFSSCGKNIAVWVNGWKYLIFDGKSQFAISCVYLNNYTSISHH